MFAYPNEDLNQLTKIGLPGTGFLYSAMRHPKPSNSSFGPISVVATLIVHPYFIQALRETN